MRACAAQRAAECRQAGEGLQAGGAQARRDGMVGVRDGKGLEGPEGHVCRLLVGTWHEILLACQKRHRVAVPCEARFFLQQY